MQVYATGNGSIRARIDASGAALSLFRAGDRNRIIRDALVVAGNMWLGKFKPLRFTDYVQRKPFGYPRRPVKLATLKLRTAEKPPLSTLWAGIKQREFMGWDPWGPIQMPQALEAKFYQRDRAKYTYAAGLKKGRIHWRLLHEDIRKWAKDRTREYAANLADDGVMMPLVLDGKLRDEYSKNARATATATAKRARLTITIPRGDRQNKWAVRILGMLPVWEFNEINKAFGLALQRGIASGLSQRFAASTDGRSAGAPAPTRPAGAGPQRQARSFEDHFSGTPRST
jgi:hypothetical protein